MSAPSCLLMQESDIPFRKVIRRKKFGRRPDAGAKTKLGKPAIEVANVGQRAPDGRCRCHRRLTRCVRPPRPCRPSKLRFEVEAQRWPGSSRSAFMARHIEQPCRRHSKPASMKILSRPSFSASCLHQARTRHDHRRYVGCHLAAASDLGSGGAQVLDAAVGARADEHAIDPPCMSTRRVPGFEIHIGERACPGLAAIRPAHSPGSGITSVIGSASSGWCPRSPSAESDAREVELVGRMSRPCRSAGAAIG